MPPRWKVNHPVQRGFKPFGLDGVGQRMVLINHTPMNYNQSAASGHFTSLFTDWRKSIFCQYFPKSSISNTGKMSTYAFLFTRPAQIQTSFSLLFFLPSSHTTLTSFFHISSWHHMPPLSLPLHCTFPKACVQSGVYLKSYFMMYNAVGSLKFYDWFTAAFLPMVT